ncbi:hypothetical protein Q1695_008818 [Nippostrongylus brasiliensis]|nr:hypothetical protein Q1695_008818 [Nippostrongylus brasiliensis]
MTEDTYTCRVQYVDDSDPFAPTSNAFLEPMRPVTFAFRIHETIADQLPEIIRTLRAPHKPGDSALQLYKSLDKGGGEFLSYLDSDLTLADQNDEFGEMKSDSSKNAIHDRNLPVALGNLPELKDKDSQRSSIPLSNNYPSILDFFGQNEMLSELMAGNLISTPSSLTEESTTQTLVSGRNASEAGSRDDAEVHLDLRCCKSWEAKSSMS